MVHKNFIAFGRPAIGDEEIAAVERVLRSGWIGMGPETVAFEHDLAAFVGVGEIVTVASCTNALFLALKLSGVGPGDEVVVPSLTWCSTANAALYLGAHAVFADIDPDTLSVTADSVLARVTPRTKAVVVVHYGGLAVDMADLRRRLPSHIEIVEDAAHALGARYADGRMVGSLGTLTCFSFYANKNLSTGEGGAIACTNPVVAERVRSLRLHAMPTDAWQRFTNPAVATTGFGLSELGYKMNYTDLQAAIGRVQLRRQDEFARTRMAVSDLYRSELASNMPMIGVQAEVTSPRHARHLFPILLPRGVTEDRRNRLVATLRQQGIGASVHYAPLHQMPLYAPQETLPVTEDIAARIMTLPISASLSPDDAKTVIDTSIEAMQHMMASA